MEASENQASSNNTTQSSNNASSSPGYSGITAPETAPSFSYDPKSMASHPFDSTIPRAPSLSLPSGGGAVQSMGEKVTVNLSNGTGSASIPIRTTSARGKMDPNLELTYSSGGGNGPFGLGWGLSLQKITRKTEKGLPTYNDYEDGDVFILSDSEDLVPVWKTDAQGKLQMGANGRPLVDESTINGYAVRKYAPRIQSSFNRIERWTSLSDPHDVYWRTLSPQNVTTIFGDVDAARISDPSVAPGNPPCIFSWLVTQMYDAHGNALVCTYKQEDSSNVDTTQASEAHRSAQANTYIKTVRYGNIVPNRNATTWTPFSAATLPTSSWKFSVVFDYGEHDLLNPKPNDTGLWACRQDAFSTYRSCFEIRTYRLCQRILMFHHFNELGVADCLVSSTDLTYLPGPSFTYLASAAHSGYSLNAATGSYTKASYPPVTYEYIQFPIDAELAQLPINELDYSDIPNVPGGLDNTSYQLIDLNGEGLPGIVTEQAGALLYAENTSTMNVDKFGVMHAKFEAMEIQTSKPLPSTKGADARFGDVAGTGNTSIIMSSTHAWGYYERGDDDEWEPFKTFHTFPNLDIRNKHVRFVDLTGDGLADVLEYSDQTYTWYPSLGECGFDNGVAVVQSSSEILGAIPAYGDNEGSIFVADMTGDGLNDVVRIRNGEVCYWPNCGYGRFGGQVIMDNAPALDAVDNFDQRRIRLADIDGSGTTDILYLSREGVDMYLNQAGNSLSDRKSVALSPAIDSLSQVSVLDLLGNGTSCLVWSSPTPSAVPSPLRYVDFMRGQKPHLLTKTSNNMGSTTTLHYSPSTKFYLQDKQSGTPWVTHLPFPVQCVERQVITDTVSGNVLVRRYSYHHGYFDGYEREFRGFGRVEQWDTEGFAAMSSLTATNNDVKWHVPPTHTKTWFHTGFYMHGTHISDQLEAEYFVDPQTNPHGRFLPRSDVPVGLTGEEQREAARSLKGRILRTEIYADDDSTRAGVPYSIMESSFSVAAIQAVRDRHQHGVYFVHECESLNVQLERKLGDPRIQHGLILQVDSFGNVLKQMKIAYGRRTGQSTLSGVDKLRQETSVAVFTETDFTNMVDAADDYVLPLPCEMRQWEVSNLDPPNALLDFNTLVANDFNAIISLPEIPYEAAIAPGVQQRRMVKRLRVQFRADNLSGLLPLGQQQTLSLPGMAYEMEFTPGMLSSIFNSSTSLLPNPSAVLPGTGAKNGGYINLNSDGIWWRPSGQARYAADPSAPAATELVAARAGFFQPLCYVDVFGNASSVALDPYALLVVKTTDALGNTITATRDYRTMGVSVVTSPNGNRSAVAYDALGLLVGTAVMGKASEMLGDSLDGLVADISDADRDAWFAAPTVQNSANILGKASSRMFYDVGRAWKDPTGKTPVYSATILRETHVSDPLPADGLHVQIKIKYSDGFGRVIQEKDYTSPGPLTDSGPDVPNRWVGTGWTIFNNKGSPVQKYEAFFDNTHQFTDNAKVGVAVTMMYDPAGRVVATLHPNHMVEKAVIADAWTKTAFDANDNVLVSNFKTDPDVGHYFDGLPSYEYLPSWYDARSTGQLGADEQDAAMKAAAHANTPTTAHMDPLGRDVLHVQDNGAAGKYSTHIALDVQGRQLSQTDPKGRTSLIFDYSMGGVPIDRKSLDAGDEWTLADVLGKPLLKWNSRGFQFRFEHDALRRPTNVWFMDLSTGGNEILTDKIVYGEQAPNALALNLRGQVWQMYDQAGQMSNDAYDFTANLVQSTRSFAVDYKDMLDWSGKVPLETETMVMTGTFDCLNRPVTTVMPDGTVTCRFYNQSARIDKTYVNSKGANTSTDPTTWTPIFTAVEYNARGQTGKTVHGNGTTSIRTYDPQTFRLQTLTTSSSSNTFQALTYTYDAQGNITTLRDAAQQTIYFRNNRVDPSCKYTYDPLYRLTQASGREHLGQANGHLGAPTPTGPAGFGARLDSPGDGTALGTYNETYAYDEVGNMLAMTHAGSDPASPGWTRTYTYNETSLIDASVMGNRLSSTAVGSTTEAYGYAGSAGLTGNMTAMSYLSLVQWNYKDQLQATATQKVTATGSTPETTYYVYDSGGQRIRKITERATSAGGASTPTKIKETIYVADYELFRRYDGTGTTVVLERTTAHIAAEAGRTARIETRTVGTDPGPAQLLRFQLTNLLGSACIELDPTGQVISYEEYYPFGATSYSGVSSTFSGAAPKRYGYCGKERDEESGLDYFGARYYASWLGRWTAPDPEVDGRNLYQFVLDNPIKLIDPDGHNPDDASSAGGGSSSGSDSGEATGKRQSPWTYVGSSLHVILLPYVQANIAVAGFPLSARSFDTLPGGSKNGSGGKGEIDLAVFLPDPAKPGYYIAHIYELKPDSKYPSRITKYQNEVRGYLPFVPAEIDGYKVSQAVYGTALSGLPAGVIRRREFDIGDFTIEVSFRIVDGVVLYKITPYAKPPLELTEAMRMRAGNEARQYFKEINRKAREKLGLKPLTEQEEQEAADAEGEVESEELEPGGSGSSAGGDVIPFKRPQKQADTGGGEEVPLAARIGQIGQMGTVALVLVVIGLGASEYFSGGLDTPVAGPPLAAGTGALLLRIGQAF